MSQLYNRSISINGDTGKIYDGILSFLKARGFKVTNLDRPSTIVAEKGTLRPTMKIEKYPHTLIITFHPSEEVLKMSFIYMMSDFWHYTPGDRQYFDNEIDLFVRGLVADGAKVTTADGKPIASSSYIDEIRQLAKLKSEGVLSGDEFEQKKRKLLSI